MASRMPERCCWARRATWAGAKLRAPAHVRLIQQELKDGFMAAMDFFNRDPVVHTWTYKLDKAA